MASQLPNFEARNTNPSDFDTDIIAVYQDSAKKALAPKGAYAAQVERLRKADAFSARQGAVHFVRFGATGAGDNVLFAGCGEVGDVTEEKLRIAGGAVWARLVAEKSRSAVVQVGSFFEAKGFKTGASHSRLIRAFAEGLILSAYGFRKYHSKDPKSDGYTGPSKITFVTKDKSEKSHLDRELFEAHAVGEAVTVTRDWSNEPSNFGTPEYYAAEARKLAKKYGLKIRVMNEAEAAREKMGLFLAVGQGAERESRVVVVEYSPKKAAASAKTLAIVGKGITFDSGGISIKPSARMEEMKHDMTGAATIMGAMILASLWEVPNKVIGIMGFAENMPDGNAIQPGNVFRARNGKSVEVINTDAEGRLILADLLDLAHDYKPDAIVNAATLTGAVGVALGKQCCAILGNDDGLIEAVRSAGDANGERMWQLPLFDEYFEDMKSDWADMRNSCNDSSGGTIRGAIFLKQFIKKGMPWAHLDIASMAYGLTHLSYYPKKGATGIYVRSLAQLAKDY